MKLLFCLVLVVAFCGSTLVKAKDCKHKALTNAIPDGKTVTINCPKGFKPMPGAPTTINCTNGVLSPDTSKVKAFCDPIGSCVVPWREWFGHQPIPKTFKPGQYMNMPKEMCTHRGFKVNPSLLKIKMKLTCKLGGKWNVDVKQPPCISTTCLAPKQHKNAWIEFNSKVAQYTCDEGFKYKDGKTQKMIKCVNKKWESLKDKCTSEHHAAPATEEVDNEMPLPKETESETEEEDTTTEAKDTKINSPETETTENEGNEMSLPKETEEDKTEEESNKPALETNFTDPEDDDDADTGTIIKTTDQEEEDEETKEVVEAIDDAEECEVVAMETLSNRLLLPLTYTMVRSQDDCKVECETAEYCAGVGIILYEKIPVPFRKLVAPKLGPNDIVCVRFVKSLIAAFIKMTPLQVLTKRSTYSFLYERVCKPANLTTETIQGESKVCPGVGRQKKRVDQYYTISGAAGAYYTVKGQDVCETHCMADPDCTAIWYKPQLKTDNCQLYHGNTTLEKPAERTFTKSCDTTGACQLKESKYKVIGPGEPMGVPKLDECRHRCVSEKWCKGVRWTGSSKQSKCLFLMDKNPKFEKNLITVFPCKKIPGGGN